MYATGQNCEESTHSYSYIKGYNWTDVPIITFHVCDWTKLRGVSHSYIKGYNWTDVLIITFYVCNMTKLQEVLSLL